MWVRKMKAFSKILYLFLAVLIFLCAIILLSAICPPVAKVLSNFSTVNNQKQEMNEIAVKEDTLDIDALLREIEARAETQAATNDNILDLGLARDTVYSSLDSYYSEIVRIVTDNHTGNTELKFKLLLSEDLFEEWYDVNMHVNNETDSYGLELDYDHLDDGSYLISHDVIFK